MAKINNTSTVSYNYTLPDSSVISKTATSNLSSTENMTTSFRKLKLVSKSFAMIGDEVKITLVLTNESEAEIFDVHVLDTVDEKVSFVPGSVTVDDVEYAHFDPEVGFDLPAPIAKGSSSTVVYSVTVDENPDTDACNFISSITYSVNEITDLQEQTNVATFDLIDATISILKSANKKSVVTGDTVVYTNLITNSGSVVHKNVHFSDTLPAGVSFVTGSVKIDGVAEAAYDPVVGFDLGELSISAHTTVEFSVVVL